MKLKKIKATVLKSTGQLPRMREKLHELKLVAVYDARRVGHRECMRKIHVLSRADGHKTRPRAPQHIYVTSYMCTMLDAWDTGISVCGKSILSRADGHKTPPELRGIAAPLMG